MAYAALGLRANPFVAESTPGVKPDLFLDEGEAAPRAATATLVQVVGVRGAGKTSLILHWARQRPGPYRHVDPVIGRWRPPPVADIAYWDEADRFPFVVLRSAFRRAARRGATIVAATHRDLTAVASRAGLASHEIQPLRPTPDRVVAWARRRIDVALLSDSAPRLTVDRPLAAEIVARSNGSWRDVGDHLHSWAARAARDASVSDLP